MSDRVLDAPTEEIPEKGKLPKRFGKRNNLAKDDKLTQTLRKWLTTNLEHYRKQEERQQFCDEGGVMDTADKMTRVALRRDTTSEQYQDTLSNTASTAFLKGIRAMSSGEAEVYLSGPDLPAKYEGTFSATDNEVQAQSLRVAEQQTLLEEYTWEQDNRRKKLRQHLYYNNKYGQEFITSEWRYETRTQVRRVLNEKGNFVFKEVTDVIADHPTTVRHDLKNVYFDAKIDDIQSQRCILIEQAVPWETLAAQQRDGFITNLDKVTTGALYLKDYNEETIEERQLNAGEDYEQERTGLYKVWHSWCRIPVSENQGKSGPTGNGKWDAKLPATLYWATFVGEVNDAKSVCVRLEKNPYFHGKIPAYLMHAYEDDKGAYHVSPADTVTSLYWQAVTNMNQAIDNVTLRTRVPYITDGPVKTRDLTFKANKLIQTGRGVNFRPVEVARTTEITLAMADRIEQDIFATLGTDKPILGQPLLGRTSATEATNVLEQAKVPLLEKADANGGDYLTWSFEMDAELWRQFANPKTVISLTHNDLLEEIKPAELYGPYKVTVTAITQFENTTQRRRELNAFLQNGYDRAREFMGQEGALNFWRLAWGEFNFKDVDDVFPPTGDFDAKRVGVNESFSILFKGEVDEALPDENHAAHLVQHKRWALEYGLIPEEDQNPEWIRNHDLHIQQHENFLEAPQPGAPQAGIEQPGALAEGTVGELGANPLEAVAGAEAALG